MIIQGDCRMALRELPEKSVQCCVTSPPYWRLRSYLPAGHPLKPLEIGQEKTPEDYVATMVQVLTEVWRVLKDDGTLWLNLGDSYTCGNPAHNPDSPKQKTNHGSNGEQRKSKMAEGLKPKDLVGIPWRVALALQAAGWYLRSDIIWAKANCMPEPVTDRPTRSHEYIFLLTKSERYFYDHDAIKEPCIYDVDGTGTAARKARQKDDAKSLPTIERAGIRPAGYKNSVNFDGKNKGKEQQLGHSLEKAEQCTGMRNKRDVWTVAIANYHEAHFATFPPELIKPCILAGSRHGDTVLDPFGGSGTTGQVALEYGRNAVLVELNMEYHRLIEQRTCVTSGML